MEGVKLLSYCFGFSVPRLFFLERCDERTLKTVDLDKLTVVSYLLAEVGPGIAGGVLEAVRKMKGEKKPKIGQRGSTGRCSLRVFRLRRNYLLQKLLEASRQTSISGARPPGGVPGSRRKLPEAGSPRRQTETAPGTSTGAGRMSRRTHGVRLSLPRSCRRLFAQSLSRPLDDLGYQVDPDRAEPTRSRAPAAKVVASEPDGAAGEWSGYTRQRP